MVASALAWSLRLSACCLWPARMFYLPFRKVLSYRNTSATVIVGTWGEHLNDYVISLGLAESRILSAAPADTRPRTPPISFCTVQLETLCAACSLATLCLFAASGPGLGELFGFWCSMVFRHAPIPRKGSGDNNNNNNRIASSNMFRNG